MSLLKNIGILAIILGIATVVIYVKPDDTTGIPVGAVVNNTPLKFPASVNSVKDRYEWATSAQEILRLEHNVEGKKWRDGDITTEEWEAYKVVFNEKNNELSYYIAPNREAVMKEVLGITKLDHKNNAQVDQISNIKNQYKQSKRWSMDTKQILK